MENLRHPEQKTLDDVVSDREWHPVMSPPVVRGKEVTFWISELAESPYGEEQSDHSMASCFLVERFVATKRYAFSDVPGGEHILGKAANLEGQKKIWIQTTPQGVYVKLHEV